MNKPVLKDGVELTFYQGELGTWPTFEDPGTPEIPAEIVLHWYNEYGDQEEEIIGEIRYNHNVSVPMYDPNELAFLFTFAPQMKALLEKVSSQIEENPSALEKTNKEIISLLTEMEKGY